MRFDSVGDVPPNRARAENHVWSYNKHFTFRDISRWRSRLLVLGCVCVPMHNDLNLEFRAHGAVSFFLFDFFFGRGQRQRRSEDGEEEKCAILMPSRCLFVDNDGARKKKALTCET